MIYKLKKLNTIFIIILFIIILMPLYAINHILFFFLLFIFIIYISYKFSTIEKRKKQEQLKTEDINNIINEFFKKAYEQQQYHIHVKNNTKDLDNAYKLLRLSNDDSIFKIKSTYRTLAIKWHPDKWTTSTKNNKIISERNFKKLQNAYSLIKKDKNII